MRVFYSLVIAAVFLLGVGVSQAQEAKSPDLGLSVFKLGEVNANDKQAGEAIDKLAKHLSDQVKDAKFVRRGVRSKPDDTLTLLKDDKNPTALAIVSPGFYFKHKDSLKLTALAEARRGGFNGEQYTLVGKVKAEKYPEGKKVATTLDADLDWLDKVVLPRPQGAKPVQWVHYDNLADAGYLFVDEPKSAPDFILLDRVSLKIFQDDADLKALVAGITSELLPQDLVVEVDGRLGKHRDATIKVLAELDQTPEGKKLGELLQTATFPAPDEKRLQAAAARYK